MHEFYIYSGAWHDQDLSVASGGPAVAAGSPITSAVDTLDGFFRIDYVAVNSHVHEFYIYSGAWHDQDLTPQAGGVAIGADKKLASIAPPLYLVSGQVLAGGTGFAGVTVSLSGTTSVGAGVSQSVVTNSNGSYSFSVPGGGNYTVTPSDEVYTFQPAAASFNGLSANQSANFTGYINGVSTNPSTPDPPPATYPNSSSLGTCPAGWKLQLYRRLAG